MSGSRATGDLLRHLASRPGHDEVKADFRQLLIEEFGVELGALDFDRRVPEIERNAVVLRDMMPKRSI